MPQHPMSSRRQSEIQLAGKIVGSKGQSKPVLFGKEGLNGENAAPAGMRIGPSGAVFPMSSVRSVGRAACWLTFAVRAPQMGFVGLQSEPTKLVV